MKYGRYAPRKASFRHHLLLAGIAFAVLVVGAFGAFMVLRSTNGPLPFDRERWDATANWEDLTRNRMADSLLESGRLIGMSRAEVVDLLGEPPPTSYFNDFDLVYILGQEHDSIMRIDSEWLVMRIDATGKVNEALLVTD